MATRIQVRRDSSSDWNITNPILAEGEIGYETDSGKLKIGNGSQVWTSLEYFSGEVDLSEYLTQASASTTYLAQDSASTTYLAQASASSTYLTQTSASTTYLSEIPQLQLINTQVFNSSGTYVVPTNAVEVKIEAIGAGAGGAGGSVRKNPAGSSIGGSSGGDGGPYFEFYKKIVELSSSSVSVIIGSGGLGGNSASTTLSSTTVSPTNLALKGGDSYFDNIFIPGAYSYSNTTLRYYDTFLYNSMSFIKSPKSVSSDNYKGGAGGGTGGTYRSFDNALVDATLGGKSTDDLSLIILSTGIASRNGSGSIGVGSTEVSVPGGNASSSSNPGDGGPGGGGIVTTVSGNITAGNGANGTNPGGGGGGGGNAISINPSAGDLLTSGAGGNGGNAQITVKAYGYI
jgi:hypothetical protein